MYFVTKLVFIFLTTKEIRIIGIILLILPSDMEKRVYDDRQKEVIEADGGYHLVLAPPGCGKTEVLAERIMQAHRHGVAYGDMLCLTFTNRASRGMRERVAALAAQQSGQEHAVTGQTEGAGIDDLFVGNVHRFCSKFLFENEVLPMETSILDEEDSASIIADYLQQDELTVASDAKVRHQYSKIVNLQHFMHQYAGGYPRELMVHGEDVNAKALRQICSIMMKDFTRNSITELYHNIDDYGRLAELNRNGELQNFIRMMSAARHYEKYKRQHNLVDFADLLLMTYDTLKSGYEGKRYSWIQIDEIQDLSPLQLEIVNLITATESPTVMYLGDSQQAIYSFMGAKSETLNMLASRCTIHNLYTNYRSPKYLLDVFNTYGHEMLGLDERLLPQTSRMADAARGDLLIECSDNNIDEQQDIAELVKRIHTRYPEETVAVVVSYNSEADDISARLTNLGVSHFKVSGRDLFSETAVKLLLAHFSVAMGDHDFLAWSRIVAGIKAVGSNAAARDMVRELALNGMTPADLMRNDGITALQEFLQLYSHEDIVVFDTETTGLSIEEDDVVQIAAVKLHKGQFVEGSEFNVFIRTEREIPATLGDLKNPLVEEYQQHTLFEPAEAMQRFVDYAEGCVLLGHNSSYDYHIMDNNMRRRCGRDDFRERFPRCLDTLHMARIINPRLRSHKLRDLIEEFGLEGENSHLANDDILATWHLAEYCFREGMTKAAGQMDLPIKYSRATKRLRETYKPLYDHTRALLFEQWDGDEPALLAEWRYVYGMLTSMDRVEPIKKMDYVERYLAGEVIGDDRSPLHVQLEQHMNMLNTLKEADLCGSRSMSERVFVSTVHKAKGLEFDNVIVYEVSDGNYPGFFARDDVQRQQEEARRLYVALTRAKQRLILMWSSKRITQWGRVFEQKLSPFVACITKFFQKI